MIVYPKSLNIDAKSYLPLVKEEVVVGFYKQTYIITHNYASSSFIRVITKDISYSIWEPAYNLKLEDLEECLKRRYLESFTFTQYLEFLFQSSQIVSRL